MGKMQSNSEVGREPLLITVDEVCRLLQISRRTAFQWMSDGKLDSIKVGSVRRVKMASVRKIAGV
jgi:excisionase family DNA binding protein